MLAIVLDKIILQLYTWGCSLKGLFGFIALLFSLSIQAAEITHLRNDQSIPEHCRTNDVSDFLSADLKYITYSRTGAVNRGFDHEYNITREELRRFWSIFKNDSHGEGTQRWVSKSKNRLRDYNMIMDNYEDMDFDFNEEGQVLEVLALLAIKEKLDTDRYYITGSVAYSGGKTSNRIGELDLVVGHKETCKIILVGEVKINPRRLGKAKGQLSRFRRFLDSHK